MARKHLAAVPAGEKAAEPEEPKRPATIKQAVESSERDLLVSMRAHLATELDKGAVPAHALAGVMAKLREYDRDIRAIDLRGEEESERRGPTEDEAWQAI